jgi:hypothetical protein
MTTERNDLAAALTSRLADLTALAGRLERHAAGPAPPLLLAKALVSVDRVAAVLRKHVEALAAATQGG